MFLSLSLSYLLITGFRSGSSGDVFHGSNAGLERILEVEKAIAKQVEEYLQNLERRIVLAKRYLEDRKEELEYKTEDWNGTNSSSSVTDVKISQNDSRSKSLSDPLQVFKLIRRFVSTLPQLEKEMHQDHERRLLKSLENVRKGIPLPTQRDLNFATEGLIRVQDAYDLDVSLFATGDFDGLLIPNSSLTAADSYLIGSYALDANIFTRAIEWLEHANYLITRESDTSIPHQTVWDKIQEAVSRHNAQLQLSNQQSSVYTFDDKLHLQQVLMTNKQKKKKKRRNKLLKTNQHQLYMKQSSFTDLTNFAALCRGQQLQSQKVSKTWKCWLDGNAPKTILDPVRVEMLHDEPCKVLQLYNILSDSVLSEILRTSRMTSLSRSQVHNKQKEVSASRTSSSTWIHDHQILEKLNKAYARIESVVGLNLNIPGAKEEFQVSSYTTCGHYNPHLDNILTPDILPGLDKDELDKGDRLATIMFYLSQVPRGGYSAFPRLGIVAKPIKGSALVWFNSQKNGQVDPLSLHGGCPVLYGNKWIANQWIRANSQMFVKKCPLTRA